MRQKSRFFGTTENKTIHYHLSAQQDRIAFKIKIRMQVDTVTRPLYHHRNYVIMKKMCSHPTSTHYISSLMCITERRNMKVIVIGAGMAGLSAAIRLQAKGYEVEIFEKNDQPGGKMSQIRADGYQFDVGPTIVMMPEIYKEIFHEVGKDDRDYIEFIRLEPMYDCYFKDTPARKYRITSDLVELQRMLEARGQETSRGFLRFLDEIHRRYQIALNHFIRRPFRYRRDMYNPFMLWQALKLKTFNSADNMMAKYIPDRDVRQMMSFQTLYIGVSPKKGPSLYNIIPMIEILYGIHMFKGGMFSYAKALEKLFLELGGKIHYRHRADEILIENRKAKGIRCGANSFYSDFVISNVDFPYTMKHLITQPEVRGKYTPEKIDRYDYSCSCLVFYWGVDGTYEHLNTHQFVITKDLDENLNAIFNGNLIPDPSIYLFIPSNTDKDTAPEGKSAFYVLIPVSECSTAKYEFDEQTISYYRSKALEQLKTIEGLENIGNRIEKEWIYTPKDFESKFSAYNGATFGLQPTLRQSNHFRPQAKCHTCEGLYFAGSGTHPGAGVPITLESGKICAGELIRDAEHGKSESRNS